MLKGKTVVLGITGSIAAYKMANVASMLAKQHCDVQVIMTKNATQFITPLTFETLCNTRCMVDTFDRNFQYNVEHVALAKRADLVMVAPASANIIAKMSHGIADDMLSTTVLACRCKKLVAPAMNTNMYENPITQDNLETLRRYGFGIIDPAVGMLACKDVGAGKLPKEELLYNHILQEILYPKDLAGKKVLVTAGPTCEPVDPVRIYTNRSSGKMGYALARECSLRGADVTLVTGKTYVQLRHGFLQTAGLLVGDAVGLQHVLHDVVRHAQLFRADKHEPDVLAAGHGLDEGVHGAAEFQVAAQADGQVIQPSHAAADGHDPI